MPGTRRFVGRIVGARHPSRVLLKVRDSGGGDATSLRGLRRRDSRRLLPFRKGGHLRSRANGGESPPPSRKHRKYASGGVDLFRLTITNLLGIRVDSVGVASVADFVSVFADPLSVELTQPLIVASGSGETVEFGQGRADREADELARLLSEQGTGDQLALLVRQGAVWEAAFAAAADDGTILERILEALDLASDVSYQALSTAVVADPLLTSAIPTNRAVGVGPDAERYTVSTEDGAAFVDEVLEYLRIVDEPRVRVEILNGNGLVGTTAPIARVLIESGFRVVFTDNADQQDYALSRFIAQGPDHQQAAVAVQRLLGSGEVVLEQRQPSGVVDLTIIVGSDLATQG